MTTIDVIIPVYRPDKKFFSLLTMLNNQTVKPAHIMIVNTEQKYFDGAVMGTRFWDKYKNLTVKHISKKEFDHAKTRNYGAKLSKSPYFVMMTQDAVPANEYLIEELMREIMKKKTAVAYARQIADDAAEEAEKYTRSFNYPPVSLRKNKKSIETMGVKAFFASNVCAVYNKEIFDSLGGFKTPAIFNEDMIYAFGAIMADYEIAYAAQAMVIHSHNYSNKQQIKRNFDLGVSHADYPEVFGKVKSESEGITLVKKSVCNFIKKKQLGTACKFIIQSGCKYIGYFLGKRYKSLPKSLVKRFSMNREYWM